MQELIAEIAIYLGLAALLGFLIAFLIWGFGQRRRIEAARSAAAAAVRTSVDGDSPLRTQIDALTRERDRLEHRVEVLSAQVASLTEAGGAAENDQRASDRADDVAAELGTVNLSLDQHRGDALDAAAASFPALPQDAKEETSIFSADQDPAEPVEADDGAQTDSAKEVDAAMDAVETAAAPEPSTAESKPQVAPRKLFRRRLAAEGADGGDEASLRRDLLGDRNAPDSAEPDPATPDPATSDPEAPTTTSDPSPDQAGGNIEAETVSQPDTADESTGEVSDEARRTSLAAAAEALQSELGDSAEPDDSDLTTAAAEEVPAALADSPDDVETPAETTGDAEGVDDSGASAEPAKPAFILNSAPDDPDDLTRIKGIGKATENKLNRSGIWHFRQIAGMTEPDREWVRTAIGGIPGRITRDRWVEQARQLMDQS